MLSKAKTIEAVERMEKLFPNAHCELNHETAFQLLIATILSAQATDKGVNKVTPKLFAIYPTAHALANSEEEVVIECIQSLGLYRNKAKNIRLCAQQLVEKYNGEVPRTSWCRAKNSKCCTKCCFWLTSFCCRYSCGKSKQKITDL